MSGSPLKVFLAGEGRHELGSRLGEPTYASADQPGFVEQMLLKVKAEGWVVAGVRAWGRARPVNLTPGRRTHGDLRTVQALTLDAKESGCGVLAFIRDEDGEQERVQAIADGIQSASQLYPQVAIAGAVVVPVLEAWILSLAGESKADSLSKRRAQELASARSLDGLEAMTEVIEQADLTATAAHPEALRKWLDDCRRALTPQEAEKA